MDIFIKRLQKILEEKDMTQRELAKLVGVTEVTISRYLNGERKPRIEIINKIADVLNTPTDYLFGRIDDYDKSNPYKPMKNKLSNSIVKETPLTYNTSTEMIMIPILGNIRAGKPLFAEEHFKGEMPFPKRMLTSGHEHFLLTIDGDSMIGDNIEHGDIVLIRVQNFIEYSNQIAAVIINGCEACLKHVIHPEGHNMVILRSSNSQYQDIIHPADDLIINGVYAGVFKAPKSTAKS